jgi:phosphoheptose isomerase
MEQRITASCSQTVRSLEQFCQEQGDNLVRLARQLGVLFAEGGQLLIGANGSMQVLGQLLASDFVFRLDFDRPVLPAISLGSDGVLSGRMAGAGKTEQLLLQHYRALESQNHLLLILSDEADSSALRLVRDEVQEHEQPVALISNNCRSDALMNSDISIGISLGSQNSFRRLELCQFAGHLLCELVEQELFGN